MQSKMTEKEFRNRYLFRVQNRLNGEEVAVQIAREAGLEFAPAPVKLPERLVFQASTFDAGWLREQLSAEREAFEDGQLIYAVFPDGVSAEHLRQCAAVLKEAAARYNAYPGLRAAAEELANRCRPLVERCWAVGDMERALEALDAELAKGPKP